MNAYRSVCIVSALAGAWLAGCNSQPEPGAEMHDAVPVPAPNLADAATQPRLLVAMSRDEQVAADAAPARPGVHGEGIRPSSGASGIKP